MSLYSATASSRLLDWDLDDDTVVESEELPELEGLDYFRIWWYWQFEFDQYDWDDPEFIRKNTGAHAYRVIQLTQGYFMIVSLHDHKRMTQFPDGSPKKWSAHVQRDPRTERLTGIYGIRKGRRDEPSSVLAHRELIGCLNDSGVVDHKNGWGLDNRRGTQENPVNLRYTSHSENGHNAMRSRTTDLVLPRGVELRRKNRQGKPLYGGKYCKRSGLKVRTVRSGRVWLTPEPAARWYQNQIKKMYQQRTAWAHNPESVSYPEFPRYLPHVVPF